MIIIKKSFKFLKRHGLRRFIPELYNRSVDLYYERKLNINTIGSIKKEELGIDNSDARDYTALPYWAIRILFKNIVLNKTSSVFLDYGSGKGRIVCFAASFPFKRVIGVDLSEHLNTIARENIDKMRHRKAKNIEIYQTDAVEFEIPNDLNIIYFFNPFAGKVLKMVIDNIKKSYIENKRIIQIHYYNNDHFDAAIKGFDWITKIKQDHVYPDISYGVYETRVV